MRDEIQTYIEIMLDKDMIDILEIPASMEKYKRCYKYIRYAYKLF